MPQRTYITPEGLAKLEAELDYLHTVRRQEVAEQLKLAAEVGGTVDNGEYEQAKDEQSRVEGRIQELEALVRTAVMYPAKIGKSQHPEKVQIGSTVTVATEKGAKEQYVIVGSTEANPSEKKISNESPIGKALLGKRVGDEAEANVPAGKIRLKVLKIQ